MAQPPGMGRDFNMCRLSHTACESTRPCRRCVSMGKAHLCANVELRKRGRPLKSDRGASTPFQKQQQPRPPLLPLVPVMPPSPAATPQLFAGPYQSTEPVAGESYHPLESSSSSSDPLEQFFERSSSAGGDSYRPFDSSSSSSDPLEPSSSSFSSFSSPSSTLSSSFLRGQARSKSREEMLANWVSLALEELRRVKEDNRDLHRQLDQVAKGEAKNKHAVGHIKKKLKTLSSSPPQSRAHPLPPHTELTTFLPFLSKYAIPPDRFVVRNTREPFLVLRPFQLHNLGQQCPLVVFLSDACTDLLGYTLSELLGQHITTVCYLEDEMRNQMVEAKQNCTPYSVGHPIPVTAFMQCKSGRVILCYCHSQHFYNQHGRAGWCVAVIDSFRELSGEELPLGWMLLPFHPTNTKAMITAAENETKRDDAQTQHEPWWAKRFDKQQNCPATLIASPQPGPLFPVSAAAAAAAAAADDDDGRIDLQELMSQYLQASPTNTTEDYGEWPWLSNNLHQTQDAE